MAPSRKNLSTAAALLLLLVVMAAAAGGITMASAAAAAAVGPLGECTHLSGTFHGPCPEDDLCAKACLSESSDNIGGRCDNHHPFSRCVCITNCLHA